jgi:hypothetical protein
MRRFLSMPEDIAMNVRLLSLSAFAVVSFAFTENAMAGTSVTVTYAAPAVVYAPPPRTVYYYTPPPPPYYAAPARTVVVAPAPVYAPPVRVWYGAPVVIVH